MLRAQRLDLADERELPAKRQFRIDSFLDAGKPQLFEPLDLDACERLELEVGEWPPFPECLCLTKRGDRRGRIPGSQRLAPVGRQPLEALQVELARLDAQQVAGGPRNQARLVAGDRVEHLAQPRDVVAKRVVCGVDALLREELADQAVAGDGAIRAEQE